MEKFLYTDDLQYFYILAKEPNWLPTGHYLIGTFIEDNLNSIKNLMEILIEDYDLSVMDALKAISNAY